MSTLHIRCAQDIPDVLVAADLPGKLALLKEIAGRAEALSDYCARDGVDLLGVLLERLPHCRNGSTFHSYLVAALACFDAASVTEAFKVELNQVLSEETERVILKRLAQAPEADVAWTLRPYLLGDDEGVLELLAPHLSTYTSLSPGEQLKLTLFSPNCAAPAVDEASLAAWEQELIGPHGVQAAARLETLKRDSFTFLSTNVLRLSPRLHRVLLAWGAKSFTVESVPLLTEALNSDVPTTVQAALEAIGQVEILKHLFANMIEVCAQQDPEVRRTGLKLVSEQATFG